MRFKYFRFILYQFIIYNYSPIRYHLIFFEQTCYYCDILFVSLQKIDTVKM